MWLSSEEEGAETESVSNTVAFGGQPLSSVMRVWAERRNDGENKRDRGVIQQP